MHYYPEVSNILHIFFHDLQKKLHTLTLESDRLKAEIASRNDLLVKIDQETETVEHVSIKKCLIRKARFQGGGAYWKVVWRSAALKTSLFRPLFSSGDPLFPALF